MALFATHIEASVGCPILTEYKEYFKFRVFKGVSPLFISCHIPPDFVFV